MRKYCTTGSVCKIEYKLLDIQFLNANNQTALDDD